MSHAIFVVEDQNCYTPDFIKTQKIFEEVNPSNISFHAMMEALGLRPDRFTTIYSKTATYFHVDEFAELLDKADFSKLMKPEHEEWLDIILATARDVYEDERIIVFF